jgi:hypothetical protein
MCCFKNFVDIFFFLFRNLQRGLISPANVLALVSPVTIPSLTPHFIRLLSFPWDYITHAHEHTCNHTCANRNTHSLKNSTSVIKILNTIFGVTLFFNILLPVLFFFKILTQPAYKMWIIQEPNTLELWNKLHF